MKDNQTIELHSKRLRLLPYLPHHVPKYHDWMEDEWLRDMTASERLTIDEEYQAQQEWVTDPQKCTFLVFDKAESLHTPSTSTVGMCGDVNLFLMDNDASEQYDIVSSSCSSSSSTNMSSALSLYSSSSSSSSSVLSPKAAEIMVMIADSNYRRKGYAYEAVLTMMYYGYTVLGIQRYVAKITETNYPSLIMFGGREIIQQLQQDYGLDFSEHTVTKGKDHETDGSGLTVASGTGDKDRSTPSERTNEVTTTASMDNTNRDGSPLSSNCRCLHYRLGRYMKHFNEVHLVYDVNMDDALIGTVKSTPPNTNRGQTNRIDSSTSMTETSFAASNVPTADTGKEASSNGTGKIESLWRLNEIQIVPLST